MSPQHRQIPTYSVDDALKEMAEAGVDAAVLHPPSTLGEKVNEIAVDAVRRHPDKFCILGHFDLQSPDRENIVKNWRQRPGMVGFRFTFNQPQQQSWWTDGSLDWFWAACEREKLPVGLSAGGHMAALSKIAERHPGLKLHIDHMGRHGGAGGAKDDAAFADIGELLASPNSQMSRSSCPGGRAIRASPTPTATFTNTSSRWSTLSGRNAASGEPTLPACRAPTGNA